MTSEMTSDLRAFHQFLGERLTTGSNQLSPEEVLDEWRILHPTADELAESITAVRRAIADMHAGDRGRPVDAVIAELRQQIAGSLPS